MNIFKLLRLRRRQNHYIGHGHVCDYLAKQRVARLRCADVIQRQVGDATT